MHGTSAFIPEKTHPHCRPRLLWVEDESSTREFFGEILAGTYAVEAVQSAEQALDAVHRQPPDLVLSDVLLPGLSGIELTRLLRADASTAGVPIVLLTASHEKELLLRGMEAGADDFLSKPPDLLELDVRLRTHRQLIELRREAAALHGDERYRLIVESARDYAIFSYDAEGRVRSWNAGAEALTGFSAEEMLNQPMDILYTTEDREQGVPAMETRHAHQTGRFDNERWHQRKDGTLFWGSGIVMPLREGTSHPGCLKILRDQTALHQTQEEHARLLHTAQAARQEAEAANAAKDRFLAALNHELRTPLTPVIMALHLLTRQKDLPASVREIHDMIGRNVDTELRLISDLLDVSRITDGKLDLNPSPMDLHEAVRRTLEVCGEDFAAKRLKLTVALAAEQHRVLGEEARLQQVFWNLLKNAAKFTPEGGQVTVSSSSMDDSVVVEIADTGSGIEADMLERVFKTFELADATRAQRDGGLGLGLTISHAIVAAHGGQTTVESHGRDRGTTFRVRLPAIVD